MRPRTSSTPISAVMSAVFGMPHRTKQIFVVPYDIKQSYHPAFPPAQDPSMAPSLPSHAQIVILGGGIMGSSTAYHLTKLGFSDTVLLERAKLTGGTTWHSAAMVRQLRSTPSLTTLTKYSVELYSSLAAETGQETGWTQCGSIMAGTSPDRMTHLRRQSSLAGAFKVETHEIDRAEIAKRLPIARVDDVIAGIYAPHDGRVNPSDAAAALIKGARSRGLRVFEDTPVTNILVTNGRVTGVETPFGRITCEKLVICAGLWSREVGLMAGVTLPLNACEHYALITKPFDGVYRGQPILGDHNANMYIREEVGGLLIGCFEPDARAVDLKDLPEGFCFDLLKEDWEHFEPTMMAAMHRIPKLENVEARTLINGPESFTVDGNFLLGETPELRGCFVGCGMNSVGMASGGGAGRALAEWVANDEPTTDLWSVDIRRFGRFRNNIAVLRARAEENLAIHYAIGYPGREYETGRNLRLTPVHAEHVAAGANFGERTGWERPNFFVAPGRTLEPGLTYGRPKWFDLVGEEHRAAREGVALIDQSPLGKLLVKGRDALAFLQRVCANDVDVPPGRLVYGPMLNDRGGYESDCVVKRLAQDTFMLVTGTAQPVRDLHWLERRRRDDEWATIVDVTNAHAVLAVMGPQARAVMKRASNASFTNADFPYLSHREIEIGGVVARAARVSYVGELGWELYVPVESARPVYAALQEAGAPLGLRSVGTLAMASLRIEKGFCSWGHDIGPDDTPYQAGMGFTAKLDKAVPFIGRDALLRQREAGIGRRRVMLRAESPDVVLQGSEPVVVDGKVSGHTTSAAYGYTVGAAVAMAYVQLGGRKIDEIVAGARFELEIAGQRVPAIASTKAFHDAKGERLRVDDHGA